VVAEESGWDGVIVSDSLGGCPDPCIVLVGVAARTDTVTLGTWVTPLARRQPWQTAKDLATLDVLSDGRVLFGAGLGTEGDWERYGRTFDPPAIAAHLEESLDIIEGLWTESEFSDAGEHFTVEDAT
jgi:alkanesulfonate monooxygenase SsuD/methylene tetrahydromethanopterin reductase-like flavin-dependent oxidoreductase (luciferase family)